MILCDGNYGLGAYGMDLVHSRPRQGSSEGEWRVGGMEGARGWREGGSHDVRNIFLLKM